MATNLSLANGPTKHLTWKELACKDGTGYPQKFVLDGRVYRLAQVFENIRAFLGGGNITVHSAYRTPKYNKKVGGAKNSQHVQGKALDIRHITLDPNYVGEVLRMNYKAIGIRGIGFYKTFTHIDIRDTEELVAWDGP